MYLAPQNIPRAIVLTHSNKVTLYCIVVKYGLAQKTWTSYDTTGGRLAEGVELRLTLSHAGADRLI